MLQYAFIDDKGILVPTDSQEVGGTMIVQGLRLSSLDFPEFARCVFGR